MWTTGHLSALFCDAYNAGQGIGKQIKKSAIFCKGILPLLVLDFSILLEYIHTHLFAEIVQRGTFIGLTGSRHPLMTLMAFIVRKHTFVLWSDLEFRNQRRGDGKVSSVLSL